MGPGHLGVDALGEGGVDLTGELPQPRRPGVGQIDERRALGVIGRDAGQRRGGREVQVVGDGHHLADVRVGSTAPALQVRTTV